MAKATVRVRVCRSGSEEDPRPHYQNYDVPLDEKTTVLQILNSIYEDQDRTIAFRRYCCGYKFCNSCAMTIDGIAANACQVVIEAGNEITLEPLRDYPLVRDLVVDFSTALSSGELPRVSET